MCSFRKLENINKLACWITRKKKSSQGYGFCRRSLWVLQNTLNDLWCMYTGKSRNFHYLRVGDQSSLKCYEVYVHLWATVAEVGKIIWNLKEKVAPMQVISVKRSVLSYFRRNFFWGYISLFATVYFRVHCYNSQVVRG